MTAGQAARRGGWIPAFGWLSSHRGEWLRPDLRASLTAWALAGRIGGSGIHRDLASKSPNEQ